MSKKKKPERQSKEQLKSLLEQLTAFEAWAFPEDDGSSESSDVRSTISTIETEIEYYDREEG